MKKHRYATLRMARVGLAAGMLNVVSALMDLVRRGEPVDWISELMSLGVLAVLFGLGGLIYSLLVHRITRGLVPPTPGIQLVAGIAAGTAVGALSGVPLMIAVPLGDKALVGAFFLGAGALVGAFCGSLAPIHRRPASPPPSH